MDESDNIVSPNNFGRKKKVSFSSSTTVSEKRFDSIGILKPIIKRRRRRNAAADESPNPVHSSNEETEEDSKQERRGELISKIGWREKTRSGHGSEESKEEEEEELAFEEEESEEGEVLRGRVVGEHVQRVGELRERGGGGRRRGGGGG